LTVDATIERLIYVADRLRRDAVALLDQRTFDGTDVDVTLVEAAHTIDGERFWLLAVVLPDVSTTAIDST
jgi:hypothetical protein